MRVVKLTCLLVAVATVGACQQQRSDQNIMIDNNVAANADIEVLPPDESAGPANESAINEADDAGSEQPSPPGTPEASMIPGQYRGRWGMVAADCDQRRSDNKGMITIGERNIVFYESTARLKEQRPAIATSFSGLFAFTGEGQTWEKVMTFTRTGDTLRRAESDGTYSYTRCR